MSYKEKLRESQRAYSSTKLPIERRMVAKYHDEGGKPAFQFYDSETESYGYYYGAIKGILIGHGMRIADWDNQYNRGVSSTLFFKKDNLITVFRSGESRPVAKGTIEEITKILGALR